jgi:hypothetical protein
MIPQTTLEASRLKPAAANPVVADCAMFAARWTAAMAASVAVPAVLIAIPQPTLYLDPSDRSVNIYFAAAATIMRGSMTAAQWLIVRRYLTRSAQWLAVTAVGSFLGYIIAAIAVQQTQPLWWMLYPTQESMIDSALLPSAVVDYLSAATGGTVLGLIVGFFQAVALRGGWKVGALWVAACILGFVGFFVSWEFLGTADDSWVFFGISESPMERRYWFHRVGVSAGLATLVYASVTGPVLWLILRRLGTLKVHALLGRFD